MTRQQKREYWQAFHHFQQSLERKYAPAIARALTAQKREFIEQYKQGSTIFRLNSAPLKILIQQLYYDAAIVFGAKVLASLKKIKARMPIGFNERMQMLIESYYGVDFLNMSEGITDTTREMLIRVLTRAQEAGQGFDDIVRQLEDTELSKIRARMIARTETVSAANKGAMLGAEESGLVVKKIWIATMDNRTRHDHRAVRTDAIAMDEAFKVGGFDMLQPGDRGGKEGRPKVPAKEIVNCRCVISFEPQRDAAGRLITA